MIIVYHQNNCITKVIYNNNQSIIVEQNKSIAYGIIKLANKFPKSIIVWCHQSLDKSLNLEGIVTLFHHNKMMLSYCTSESSFLGNRIGFVEESPFIKVNKKCTYPTWLMSSEVGVIHASVLKLIGEEVKPGINFDYFLNSVAKVGMILGLFCYSEPQLLLKNELNVKTQNANLFVLFRFVKQHFKKRWLILLFLQLVIFEKKTPILPLLYSVFLKIERKRL